MNAGGAHALQLLHCWPTAAAALAHSCCGGGPRPPLRDAAGPVSQRASSSRGASLPRLPLSSLARVHLSVSVSLALPAPPLLLPALHQRLSRCPGAGSFVTRKNQQPVPPIPLCGLPLASVFTERTQPGGAICAARASLPLS